MIMNYKHHAEELAERIEQLEQDKKDLSLQLTEAWATIAGLQRTTPEKSLELTTRLAESRIEKLMTGAIERDGDDEISAAAMRSWAFGVFLLWKDITSGRRHPADEAHMKNLTIPATYERTHHARENPRIAV